MKFERKDLLEHPVGCLFYINLILFMILFFFGCAASFLIGDGIDPKEVFFILGSIFAFITVPVMLSIYNIAYLFVSTESAAVNRGGIIIELITIVYGGACSVLFMGFISVDWFADWHVQLRIPNDHTPVFTEALPTVITVAAIAALSYVTLRLRRITNLPPLVAVIAIGGVYLGMAESIVFMIQTYALIPLDFYLISLIVIGIKLIRECVIYHKEKNADEIALKSAFLRRLHRLTEKGANLPWLGGIVALPLLGVAVAVLTLFGQAPDSIIRAWTETADWTLSSKLPPEPLPADSHYLCTVAAKGHRKVVKPIRTGYRHGHKVIVNRQLCVANAFEQLLSEKLPKTHRLIRSLYDRYGYPIAKLIRSPFSSDVVYFIMKPLEWLFTVLLYLFDTAPENRIAVQYPHAPLPARTEHTDFLVK